MDLAAVRADLAEIAQRWEDHDEDLYGLLAASGKLLEHGRALADELEQARAEIAEARAEVERLTAKARLWKARAYGQSGEPAGGA